jgi:TusA-related sulfurtransferase
MNNIVDARGFSCPQPVIMTINEINKVKNGTIKILVDTDTAKENVSRASKAQGWEVTDIKPEDDGFKVTITKEG